MNEPEVTVEDEAGKKSLEYYAENEFSESRRMGSIISYVVILILAGLPLWWKLTEVERRYFPYTEINYLQETSIQFNINVSLYTNNSHFAPQFATHLNTLKLFHIYLHIYASPVVDCASLNQVPEVDISNADQYILLECDCFDGNSDKNKPIITDHRVIFFSPRTSAISIFKVFHEVILQEKNLLEAFRVIDELGYSTSDVNQLRKFRSNPVYDLIFTVVHPEPETYKLEYNQEAAVEEFLSPLLQKFSVIGKFNVMTQWLYLVDFEQEPHFMQRNNVSFYGLTPRQTSLIITPLENRLGAGIAENPCLHFILYAAKCRHSPTYFAMDDEKFTNVVLSARWGGVQIINPHEEACSEKGKLIPYSKAVMGIFAIQLKSLMGVLDIKTFENSDLRLLKGNIPIRGWELDALRRMRVLEYYASTRKTLASLADLLEGIGNIVITEEVSREVDTAVKNTGEILLHLQAGDMAAAIRAGELALEASETAFSHPSLLALLYFPDDQKYAVYIPLFLPVMIPVLLSGMKVATWLGLIKDKEKIKQE